MSENVLIQPLFHQRSHSLPVGHAFENNTDNHQNYGFKKSSTLKLDSATTTTTTTNDGYPLPIPKSIASQFRSPLSETFKREDDDPIFFCTPKTILNVFDFNKEDNINCPLILNCKMDRGFFISQSHWTCYRRNYFQVTTSFVIPGHTDQACYALQLNSDEPMQSIKQFMVRLKACTSTSSFLMNGDQNDTDDTTLKNHNTIRPIALTQMTPKRDKGPQREPPFIPISPADSMFGNEQACVTFERLQFRVATANNGKRRASQQYFRLIFELIAKLEDGSQHVVSECYSSPLVVRGRSPGHYNNDPPYEIRKKTRPNPLVKTVQRFDYSSISSPPHSNNEVRLKSSPTEQHPSIMTLPPPQYVYAPPSMVIDTTRHTSESITTSNDSPVSYTSPHSQSMMPPVMQNTSFNNFHSRSQSANDSEFFARHRNAIKYTPSKLEYQQSIQQNDMFDNMGIERALRNWQHQVVRQRADSAATFSSYENDKRSEYLYQQNTASDWSSHQYMSDKQQQHEHGNSTKLYQ